MTSAVSEIMKSTADLSTDMEQQKLSDVSVTSIHRNMEVCSYWSYFI